MESIIIIMGVVVAAAAVYFFLKDRKGENDRQETTVVIPDEEETGMKKLALIVGINRYSTPGMDLLGCVNDANNIKQFLLECCGFEEAGIKMLTDEEATKANILGHLEWLVSKGEPGAELFYYHSGHGTQVFDLSGDESDQLDEVIVTHDHDWNDPLLDDYLANIFAKLPKGAFLSSIVDTCHSGSVTRYFVKNIAMPKDMSAKVAYKKSLGTTLKVNRLSMKGDYTQRHILLSGSRDDQTSAEATIDGVRQGVLTYNFIKVARRPVASWRETHSEVIKSLRNSGWVQEPVLSGAEYLKDRIIFGREPGSTC